ncbi:MAG: glycosyltransferase family 2 protein [Reyranellaceae bacterium]
MPAGDRAGAADEPLITAVVNNYNYGRYLHNAIGSVLRQTYPRMELIVVDDGSTDHSREIIASYGDRVRPILSANGGQANAVNLAAAAARGDYTAFLDSDDFWVPSKIEKMVALAAQRPDAGFLYHRYVNTDLHGNALSGAEPVTLLPADFRRGYLKSGGSYWHTVMSTIFMRTDLVRRIVPIQTYPNREGADSILADCSIMMTRLAAHPEGLAYRRIHGANFYAAGRETHKRTRDIREGDIRRIEWRAFCVRQILRRNGIEFDVDLDRNEWRMINLYLLGRASRTQVMRASLGNREHGLRQRIKRLRWALGTLPGNAVSDSD